ncbi:hypothetical protein GBA52_006779 [Prunus armeniaca]|nr:hypothetical protein GBA52_006779 [Prunus armeniaca]
MSERLSGTVKWFDDEKGFGFIIPNDGGDNLFVHQSSIRMQGFRTLGQGESVEFHITSDRDGRTEAADVTRLEEGPFQGSRGGGGASGRGGGRGYRFNGGGARGGVGRGGTGGGGGYGGVGRGKGCGGGYGFNGGGGRGGVGRGRGGCGGYRGGGGGYGGGNGGGGDGACFQGGSGGGGGRGGGGGYGSSYGGGGGGGGASFKCGDLGHMARDGLQGVSGSVGGSGGSESGGGGGSGGSNQCGSGTGDDTSKPTYSEVAASSEPIPVPSLNSLQHTITFEQLLAEASPWKDAANEGPICRLYQFVLRTLTGNISELEEKKGITHGFLEPKDITITGALYDEDKVAMLGGLGHAHSFFTISVSDLHSDLNQTEFKD